MFRFHRVSFISVLLFILMSATVPAFAVSHILTPDQGKWTAEINAAGANVSISGMEQPYSNVQVTVLFINDGGMTKERHFPVNVMFLIKAKITPRENGFQVKSITFECTKGKVQIEALPDYGSGGASANWW